LLEENDELKQKLQEFQTDSKLQEAKQQVEKEYLEKLEAFQVQIKLLQG